MHQNDLAKLFRDWYPPWIRYFSATEMLVKTDKGTNTIPPIDLWANILPTVMTIDKLRARLGYPINVHSVYRSPSYNTGVGSSSGSLHLKFNAIDFSGARGTPHQWARALLSMSEDGILIGGIGTYSTFVHLDTRTIWPGRKVAMW